MHAKFRATVLVLVMPDVSVHVGHVTITCPSCEYDVEQQEVEENKVDEKEELGLRGGSIQTNQDNAERERERERERGRERDKERDSVKCGEKQVYDHSDTYFGFLTRR